MKPGASFLQRRLDPPCLTDARTRTAQENEFWEFRSEFQIFANSGQSPLPAGEKGPTRERRDAKSANHWLCRSFARILLQTSKNHGFCAILWSSKITLKRTRPGPERRDATHRPYFCLRPQHWRDSARVLLHTQPQNTPQPRSLAICTENYTRIYYYTVITVLLNDTAFTHGSIRSTVHTSLYYQHEFNTVLIDNTVMNSTWLLRY